MSDVNKSTAPAALELKDITKLYSGTVALRNVSLTVKKGEVHGLIGKNGAGKSTLVGVISGLVEPSSGEILLDGHTYHTLSPITAKKHRVSIITQEPQVIEETTVAENLFFPHYLGGKGLIDWAKLNIQAAEILKKAGFPIDPGICVANLSVSERQLLLVIKACYVEKAEVIIMDEVSASLSQKDQPVLYEIINRLIEEGKTVIFISHHTEELLRVCDVVTVIRDGHNVGSFDVDGLDLKKLASLIVGDASYEESEAEDHSSEVTDEEVFTLQNYTSYGKFENISLSLKKGEIVGLAGLRGSGRTELFKSIIGVDPHDEGTMKLKGAAKNYSSPAAASKDGVVYLPEEREAEGVVPIASIRSNITMGILGKLSKGGFIRSAIEKAAAEESIKSLDIKVASQGQEVQQLSGGNKQKVLVGRIMQQKPLVCLLDEPTRGVDIEAKESILASINRGMRADSSVLITSPGVEDLMKICDRILVLYEGRITECFARDEFSEEDIYRAMQGEMIHKEVSA